MFVESPRHPIDVLERVDRERIAFVYRQLREQIGPRLVRQAHHVDTDRTAHPGGLSRYRAAGRDGPDKHV